MKIGISKKGEFVDLRIGAVVVVRAPMTGEILYNSGRLYFASKEQYKLFKKKMQRENRKCQVIRINLKKAKSPAKFKIEEEVLIDAVHSGKVFCPYCGTLEPQKDWAKNEDSCPICTIGERDFWVRTYNGSWKGGLSNAKKNKPVWE